MKKSFKGFAIFFAIFSIFVVILQIAASTDESTPSSTPKSESKPEVTETDTEFTGNWNYTQDVDKMEGNTRYFASTRSTNVEHFKFPFDGGSHFTLTVRNMSGHNEVLISVSKGNFIPSVMGDETVKVKFDTGTPSTYVYNSPEDISTDLIFIDKADKFLEDLKTAKKLLIEATFFDEGTRYMEFDVEGIEWAH